jgi:hypothetical protein
VLPFSNKTWIARLYSIFFKEPAKNARISQMADGFNTY